MKKILLLFVLFAGTTLQAQYWQQAVEYTMDIDLNVEQHTYDGTATITYTNNSPDTLRHVYFHLCFNACQPGSRMDVRSLNIKDPDRRVQDRISKLAPDEVGYQHITSLTQSDEPVPFEIFGTVLKGALVEPLMPGKSTQFELVWDAQVSKQIRRSGR